MRYLFLGCFLAAAACVNTDDSTIASEIAPTSAPALNFGDGTPPGTPSSTTSSASSSSTSSASSSGAPPAVVPDAGPPPPPPPPPPSVVTSTESIMVWGKARSYVLARPSTYDAARSYPLVLALHGDGGDGAAMRNAFQLDGVAGQQVIVAYPTGTGNSWDLYTPVDSDADVAFLGDLVSAVKGKYSIAPGRVFAFGMSSGAFMANQIACRRPSLFKGIISNSGGAPDEPNDSHGTWGEGFVRCNGQNSGVAAMIIHGVNDTIVPYPSGDYDARYWAKVNGCASTTQPASPPPCVKRDGCPGDKPVFYCSIDGMGHELWSGAPAATWSFVSSL